MMELNDTKFVAVFPLPWRERERSGTEQRYDQDCYIISKVLFLSKFCNTCGMIAFVLCGKYWGGCFIGLGTFLYHSFFSVIKKEFLLPELFF